MLPARLRCASIAALITLSQGPRAAAVCRPPLHPCIAEIVYDAVGDDTGREFVELFNSSSIPFALSGARLQAGDGSGPGRWTLRWTGGPTDTIAPGGRFVIGGASIGIVPHALVSLDLQNGPDAVRMLWPDGATEVVGYGAVEFAEYACGAPAPDVASGEALARIPDDADGGSNGLDFRAAPATPGRANQPRRDVGWIRSDPSAAAPLIEPGASIELAATLENRGAESLPAGTVTWSVREAGESVVLAAGAMAALDPGDTASVTATIAGLPVGKRRLTWNAALAGDGAPENDLDSVWVRVGLGPLQLTEIQFHPAAGEGEWVEVINASGAPLDLGPYGFADRLGHPGHATPGATLAPDSLALLVQDRLALLARFPALDTTRVLRVSPWPSLNNGNDASGVADVAMLLDADGVPSDRLAYSASGVPAGVPLERDRDGRWSPAPQALGTPLEPPRARPAVSGRFDVEPRRLRAGLTEARLRWDLPWPRARVACDLYDLAGRPRGQVLAETEVSSRGEQSWMARDLSAGLYLMVLRARAQQGDGRLAVTRPIRIEAP